MKFVDRDGEPIEITGDQAGEVRTYPVPDEVPDRVVMTRAYLTGSSGRFYHRPDPDDPSRPACKRAGAREDASWNNWPSHGVPGNFPPCSRCFDVPDDVGDEEEVATP